MVCVCVPPAAQGAQVKELKKRWPHVFIFVERDNRLTVRGGPRTPDAEIEACFRLALFFKVRSRARAHTHTPPPPPRRHPRARMRGREGGEGGRRAYPPAHLIHGQVTSSLVSK